MTVWEFVGGDADVELLRQGVLVDHYVLVRVAADSYLEASLLAIQLGFIVGYATECLLRI